MRKIHILVLTILIFIGTTAFASGKDFELGDIHTNGNFVTIEIKSNVLEEKEITLTVTKNDNTLDEKEKFYSVVQCVALPNEINKCYVLMPESKNGINSTGEYLIKIQNDEVLWENTVFYYADEDSVGAFVEALKTQNNLIANQEDVYAKFFSVILNEKYKDVLSFMGLNYNNFCGEDESLQKEMMEFLYGYNISTLKNDDIALALKCSYAAALYNSGEKERAIETLNVLYDNKKLDKDIVKEILKNLTETYQSAIDFKNAIINNYGFNILRRSNLMNISSNLNSFANETGICKELIKKISNLSSVKKNTANEYIIKQFEKKFINSEAELKPILEEAYDRSITAGGGSSGSGGGGSSGGGASSGNKTNGIQSTNLGWIPDVDNEETDTVASVFKDLPNNHWALESVCWARNNNIVNGNDKGEFEPDRAVTREEFAKMLVIACELKLSGTVAYSDVTPTEWYALYVGTASEYGIVNGIGNNLFGIGQKITRQDMAVMISRALTITSGNPPRNRKYSGFNDGESISDYARESVILLYEASVVNGRGENRFEPQGIATKAEATEIIYKAFKEGE